MNLNKKIGMLLDNGFKPEFISSLTESKINFLFEKVSKRKETKEQAASANVQKVNIPATTAYKIPAGGEVDINNVKVTNQGGVATVTPTSGKPVTETEEIDEKFESKAQQGLFWARCNKCKDKDCKWCKMAEEFSKSTSKKQYEKMPEKKHPEKTVKYKKKKTNEEFTMANYFDKVASVYANNAMGKTINSLTKEQFVKKHINKIVENNLRPTMKKRDLLKLIESEIKRKKGLNEDFYVGNMEEEFDFMSDTETDVPRRKHRPDYTEDLPIVPDRTEGEPNWDEDEDEDDGTPRPRGKMGRLRMSGPGVLEPGIKEPKIKPKEPDTTPEWTPDEDEPIVPSPDVNPEPQAKRKKDFLDKFKYDFDKKMNRMDESTYKPIKYRKF